MSWLDRVFGLAPKAETFDVSLSTETLLTRNLLSGWMDVSANGLDLVTEATALGIPAFQRGIDIIAGTIAGLPLKTYTGESAERRQVLSLFDDPAGPYDMTRFNWVELQATHLAMYREAYLLHVRNGAGVLVALFPIHPDNVVKVEWSGGSKRFTVKNGAESVVYGTPEDPTEAGAIRQILGPSTTGLRGRSIFESHKRMFQIAIAAEKAAARTFTGALVAGLVSTAQDEDVDEDEAASIMELLNQRVQGVDNAGRLAFVNRHLDLKSWQMSNLDAQFAESRAFQVEEFARALGLPPHLLGQTDKQTSWGTGVAEQNLGLARYTLMSYTSRMEAAYRKDLPGSDFCEFDYKGLLQGTPKDEIDLLLAQTGNLPLLTQDEARAVINRPPIEGDTTNG